MKVTFKIWRQENSEAAGSFKTYETDGLNEEMSFLEALDQLNEKLVLKNEKVRNLLPKTKVKIFYLLV